MRFAFLILTGLALAGCAGSQDVQLESRSIQVDENAIPASASGADAGLAKAVQVSSPSYVTLTISEIDKNTTAVSGKDAAGSIAITSGSGFVVDHEGYVMTAGHVAVKPGYAVQARAANGRVYSGTVVDILPTNDMALIKLRGYAGRPAEPGSNQCLAPGSLVYSLGKPHEQGDTARVGNLQAMHFGRPVSYGKFGYPDAMVLHMGTQRGESGGPLFNEQGQLVGMVVSTLTDNSGNLLNLAHAVPAPALAGFLCSHISCSPQWAAMAQRSTASCPNS
jgi:S1-C subfamily serine protease